MTRDGKYFATALQLQCASLRNATKEGSERSPEGSNSTRSGKPGDSHSSDCECHRDVNTGNEIK